ncbi:MAG: CBS domain-containing protein [Alphaproteobacteria bacterium]|nr:CBS domain-containing protein [Alphaproteobacteria bacterium]
MDRTQPVAHIMTREVVSVQVDQKLSDARRVLAEHPFHHVPVLRGRLLVGVLSPADILPLTLEAYIGDPATVAAHLDAAHTIEGVMTHEPLTVQPAEPLIRAAELLAEGAFHSLPVVDGKGELVGIITSTDILRVVVAG